jgi:LPS-assembly protein
MDPTIDGKSLRDSFSYSRIAYFNLSQGYELGREEYELSKRLTRLFVESGGRVGKGTVSVSDYYFYDNGGHVLTLGATYASSMITVGGDFTYNSFYKDINRNFKLTTTFKPNDIWTFTAAQEYDVDRRTFVKYTNGIGYSPLNNCWKVELRHSKAEDGDGKISFNFMINYNEKGFQGIK